MILRTAHQLRSKQKTKPREVQRKSRVCSWSSILVLVSDIFLWLLFCAELRHKSSLSHEKSGPGLICLQLPSPYPLPVFNCLKLPNISTTLDLRLRVYQVICSWFLILRLVSPCLDPSTRAFTNTSAVNLPVPNPSLDLAPKKYVPWKMISKSNDAQVTSGPCHLFVQPDEILMEIFKCLGPASQRILGATSSRLYKIWKSDFFKETIRVHCNESPIMEDLLKAEEILQEPALSPYSKILMQWMSPRFLPGFCSESHHFIQVSTLR